MATVPGSGNQRRSRRGKAEEDDSRIISDEAPRSIIQIEARMSASEILLSGGTTQAVRIVEIDTSVEAMS